MPLNIAVVGMGYVGAVSGAKLCAAGHTLHGVECDPLKLERYARGDCPIKEPGLSELLAAGRAAGRFAVSSDLSAAVLAADVVMVAVGTPSAADGSVDLSALLRCYKDIARALSFKKKPTLILNRSTVPPGTHTQTMRPILQQAPGVSIDEQVGLLSHPEFLREGSALQDWDAPPLIVFGGEVGPFGPMIEALYPDSTAPKFFVGYGAAEMVKYACNAFHALKIDFANEIGALSECLGVDSSEVMNLVCADRKLNVSAAYLKPGFAFGGSCLPKDVRALSRVAQLHNVSIPVLQSILPSNRDHVERAWQYIEQLDHRRVGLIGLTFKAHTDDVRESPSLLLAQRLIGHGFDLRIYDPEFDLQEVFGANKRFLDQHVDHVTRLLVPSLKELAAEAELIVVAHGVSDIGRLPVLVRSDHHIFDLCGILKAQLRHHPYYHAFAGLNRSTAAPVGSVCP